MVVTWMDMLIEECRKWNGRMLILSSRTFSIFAYWLIIIHNHWKTQIKIMESTMPTKNAQGIFSPALGTIYVIYINIFYFILFSSCFLTHQLCVYIHLYCDTISPSPPTFSPSHSVQLNLSPFLRPNSKTNLKCLSLTILWHLHLACWVRIYQPTNHSFYYSSPYQHFFFNFLKNIMWFFCLYFFWLL